MHRHSQHEIPEGYVPVLASYDPEDETFCTTFCLDGLHIAVEMPIEAPHTMAHLARLSPVLMHVFITTLTQALEQHDGMKAKFSAAIERLDDMEKFLEQLEKTPPEDIVAWIQGQ